MTVTLSRTGPNLIWLEDRDSTARIELGEAKKLGCNVHLRAHPLEIMALLAEELGQEYDMQVLKELRIAFVIDVMIAGLLDLSELSITHSETKGGLNGGYVFVDRVLRRPDSPYRYQPVCFLSERQLTDDLKDDLDFLRDRKDADGTPHGPIEYVRKFSSTELGRFRGFIESLNVH